jgi:hypothetical protein
MRDALTEKLRHAAITPERAATMSGTLKLEEGTPTAVE